MGRKEGGEEGERKGGRKEGGRREGEEGERGRKEHGRRWMERCKEEKTTIKLEKDRQSIYTCILTMHTMQFNIPDHVTIL